MKRVDVTGKPYGGVETPHTVEYTEPNVAPTGKSYLGNAQDPRPATPDEIPKRK